MSVDTGRMRDDVTAQVGARLRAVRREQGLSLRDVQARSALEFKASALAAYERGERVISFPRLLRLASLYGVPPGDLIPRPADDVEIDLTESGAGVPGRPLIVDARRLKSVDAPEAVVLARFVSAIRERRNDHASRFIAIRADDLQVLAAALGWAPAELGARLAELKLTAVQGEPGAALSRARGG